MHGRNIKRKSALGAVAALLAVALCHSARADVVTDWNQKAQQALLTANTSVFGAADRWRTLSANEPGTPATHLEVATLFWDYYQFDDAAKELEALQTTSHDRTLYAYRLGAIYDSKSDFDHAVPEYVRAPDAVEQQRPRVP